MATSTQTLEILPDRPSAVAVVREKAHAIPLKDVSISGHSLRDLPGPGANNVTGIQETWKYPRINTWRMASIFFAFINFGMGDAAYGALIPFVNIDKSEALSSVADSLPD